MANNAANISITFTSNADAVLSEFQRKVKVALEAVGATAEGYAKMNCPVDTGRLRNSISNAVVDNEVYIGTNVEYAPVQELYNMSHKVGRAHFLRDAATTHGEEYKRIMEAALKD